MRCAVFAVTERGESLASRLKESVASDDFDIFIKEDREEKRNAFRFKRLSDAVSDVFYKYDALIFFMAAGIVVRMIARHVESKLTDPAVIVADESGKNAISLLSGHVGGGNALTLRIAAAIGANPVITTATDVRGVIAPDSLASELGLRPHPKPMIQVMNSALLKDVPIHYAIDESFRRRDHFASALSERGLPYSVLSSDEAMSREDLVVFITDNDSLNSSRILSLVPRKLIAGIGCRRGISVEALSEALSSACAKIGEDVSSVSLIASASVKRDEEGLLAFAGMLGVEVRFFENDELRRTIEAYGLKESPFVKRAIGVGNVSEAAALSCVKKGTIALKKTKWEKVTVALIWEK